MPKPTLLGLNYDSLCTTLAEVLPRALENKYSTKQLWNSLYVNGIDNFQSMTNLSLRDRELLAEHTDLGLPTTLTAKVSTDGTRKWMLDYSSNHVETVFIPEVNRNGMTKPKSLVGTVCVSSQIGCSLKCAFCYTGTFKFKKNLTSSEIIGQVMTAMKGDFPLSLSKPRKLTNVVYMGTGEPLLNFKQVAEAVKFTNKTFNYSAYRTTISTSGIAPLMREVGLLEASLAVSLHSVDNDLRDILVPINKQYPIAAVMAGCKEYLNAIKYRVRGHNRVTFEYVMLNGVNDSLREARELVRLLRPLSSHVNLIPFNTWPGAAYKCSTKEQILKFQAIIKSAGIECHVRKTRGDDILGACGQLTSSLERKRSFLDL